MQKKKKIDIYIMFWDPIAPASAFYPKPWDGSASSRNFSCFVRASSFSLSDTGTPRQCKPPWNACCWTLAGLCHQTTSCIGNRGTPLGSYASLLFEAAEKWIWASISSNVIPRSPKGDVGISYRTGIIYWIPIEARWVCGMTAFNALAFSASWCPL